MKLESRGDVAIAWLANGQMNSIAPQVIEDLGKVWEAAASAGVRALVIASSNPMLFSRRRRHQGVHAARRGRRAQRCSTSAHGLLREFGRSRVVTIAAVNGLAFGGGCELAMACDVRLAARSALFGQPEIKLGIIPGFGGTQRLPRLVGENKALEMNLVGDPIGADEAFDFGLVNRVVPDHELLDSALAWARRLAEQAPLAVEAIKERLGQGRPRRGHRGREGRVRAGLRVRRRPRGHQRLPRQAQAELDGRVSVVPAEREQLELLADLIARGGVRRRADRRGHLRAVGHPGLPHARHRPVGERRPDGGRAHRRLARGPRALLALLRHALPDARGQAAQRRAPRARRARAPRHPRRGDHAEHRHAASQGRDARARRGPRHDRAQLVPGLRHAVPARRDAAAAGRRRARRSALRLRGGR